MELYFTIKPSFASLGNAFNWITVGNLVSDTINKVAASTERYGKQLSPVDTGRLRASIHFSPSTPLTLKSVVATGTDYAVFVHEGTRYMRGRPFMSTGAEMAMGNLMGEVASRLEQEFTDAFKSLR